MELSLAANRESVGVSKEPIGFSTDQKLFLFLRLSLFLLVMGVFFPAVENNFVNFDDPLYVTKNVYVLPGLSWAGTVWAFSSTVAGNWQPLTFLSHMLDCQWYGLKPWGHHLTSVLIHAVNAVLVFVVLRRMTGAVWRSWFVAALFGLHPLHVESVAWVAERKDVLSSMFWLLTMWAYVRFVEASPAQQRAGRFFYLLTLLFFGLGLMAKSMLVTLPCVLLLLDYWPLKRLDGKNVWLRIGEKIPLFLLSVMASIVTFFTQKGAESVIKLTALPFSARVENALVSYGEYLVKMFYPADLCAYYPHPGIWPLAKVVFAVALFATISIFAVALRRQQPYLLVGWLWFVGTLVPVIGLVQVGEQAMADRYTYIPLIGMFIFLTWGAHALTRRCPNQRLILTIIALAIIGSCAFLTFQQIRWWKNGEILCRRIIAVTENNYFAHDTLASELNAEGRNDEAIEQMQEALKLKPNIPELHYHLGLVFEDKGQLDQAIRHFQEAVELNPNYLAARNDLGMAFVRQGLTDDAIQQFRQAIQIDTGVASIHYNLGNAFAKVGRLDEAAGEFQEVLRLQPEDADAHNNLGVVLFQKKQTAEAIQHFQTALKLRPDYANARANLDNALKVQMSFPEPPRATSNP